MNAKVTGLAAAMTVLLPIFSVNGAVPPATCRPAGDRPETGLPGETTAAERAGATFQGFKCNTDLVGQYQGEGASWQLTAWKNCAYFDQTNPGNPGSGGEKHPGVVVMDMTDPTNPKPTTWLNTPAMIDPWESVKVNPARQLLGAGQRPLNSTSPGDGFDVYDISQDCKNPVLQASIRIPGSFGHTGQWAPDGKTYYITPLKASPSIIAVDVTDPRNPAGIPGGIYTFGTPTVPLADGGVQLPNSRLHDLEFSKDGNTAYMTMFGGAGVGNNGLAIIDVSDFQNRRPNPQYKVISYLTWNDGSAGAQNALPITIAGKPYILMSDEAGIGSQGPAACAAGFSANGFPRLIDISDPANPVVVSKIQIGVSDPANCAYIAANSPIVSFQATLPDGGVVITAGPSGFGYSCHYCNVDDVDNAKIAGCNCFAAGLRFYDIHDPLNPKEMAYFKPPAQGTLALPASQYANRQAPTTAIRYYDWATSKVSFPKDRNATSGDVWTTSQDNGIMVIRLYSAVTVSPAEATITPGASTTLTATVSGAASTAGVTWSVAPTTGATISPSGVFTGQTEGTYTATATSILDPTKSGSSAVSVVYPGLNRAASGGCSAAASSVGLMGVLSPLVLLVWHLRRRRR